MNRLELYLKVVSLGFIPSRYLTVENHESALIDDNYYYLYLCEVQKWLQETQDSEVVIDVFEDKDQKRFYIPQAYCKYFKGVELDDTRYYSYLSALEASIIDIVEVLPNKS